MDAWIKIWTIFFYASLIIFGALAIVVSIGGFFNIKSLFKSLSSKAEELKDQTEKETGNE